jgi:hypothetical protein
MAADELALTIRPRDEIDQLVKEPCEIEQGDGEDRPQREPHQRARNRANGTALPALRQRGDPRLEARGEPQRDQGRGQAEEGNG